MAYVACARIGNYGDAPEGKGHTFSTHVRRHQASLEASATVLVCTLNFPCADKQAIYILLRSLPLFSDLTDCSNHMATRLYKTRSGLKVRAELRRSNRT